MARRRQSMIQRWVPLRIAALEARGGTQQTNCHTSLRSFAVLAVLVDCCELRRRPSRAACILACTLACMLACTLACMLACMLAQARRPARAAQEPCGHTPVRLCACRTKLEAVGTIKGRNRAGSQPGATAHGCRCHGGGRAGRPARVLLRLGCQCPTEGGRASWHGDRPGTPAQSCNGITCMPPPCECFGDGAGTRRGATARQRRRCWRLPLQLSSHRHALPFWRSFTVMCL